MNTSGPSRSFLPSPATPAPAAWTGWLGASILDFLADETAATVVEYGLIVGLVSLASLAGIPVVGGMLQGLFQKVVDAFP